jgi:hypothetical protein
MIGEQFVKHRAIPDPNEEGVVLQTAFHFTDFFFRRQPGIPNF